MSADTLTSIKVFRRVVESGSFVAAADRLDLSPAMVSKHVLRIEKRLGVRLLNRNSRTLSLTEPGRVYFERCKTVLDDLEETELELGSLGTAPRGTLRITCPSWFASQRMADMLAQFRSRFPDIVIDISYREMVYQPSGTCLVAVRHYPLRMSEATTDSHSSSHDREESQLPRRVRYPRRTDRARCPSRGIGSLIRRGFAGLEAFLGITLASYRFG
jgi:DNA-binding transcriptional LysR family regulator